MISRKDFKNSVEWVKKNHDGCSYIRVADTKQGDLCLVFGWDYDEGEVVMKLAVNIDDLQCDYDWDWNIPFDSNGECWSTETPAEIEHLDWIEKQVAGIVKALNNGSARVK